MASMLVRLYREARRRKVFRTAALYVLAAWAALQVADVLFPGFGIPEAAIEALFWAAVLGFPAALVFGWLFEIGPGGIRRTAPSITDASPEPQPLARRDYLLLASFAALALILGYRAVQQVRETPQAAAEVAGDVEPYVDQTVERLPNSVAVLPFANISDDPANEYFCDGVAEEILNSLSKFRELNVIGRTSSFAFKGSDYGIDRISGLLGVGHVLQGSVRKQGNRLRISTQLLDASGRQLWTETFDRQLADVFEIQSQIAQAVAEVVAHQVLVQEETAPPPNLEAYDHYLAGRALVYKRDVEGALLELQRAIDLDPNFAEAYPEWAIARLYGLPGQDDVDAASQAIDRALELRPGLLRAQAARGLLLLQQSPPDPVGAESVLRRALAQEPNMSDALNWLSGALVEQGRTAEAREIFERAYRIDPLHPAIAGNLAIQLARDGEFNRAIHMLRQVLQQSKPGFGIYAMLRDLYRRTGRLVDLNALAKEQALNIGVSYSLLGWSYAALGDGKSARYWFDRTLAEYQDWRYGPMDDANLANWEGDPALALRILDRGTGVPSQQHAQIQLWRGALLARSGQHAPAIKVLEALLEADPSRRSFDYADYPEIDAVHALVWSYLQTGAKAKAEAILAEQWLYCRSNEAEPGFMRNSAALHYCAETALLMGKRDESIALLERAIDAGWRDYYLRQKDPYWALLDDDPRYQALMAKVKADVDRQREEVRRIDAEDDFIARLDAANAARDASAN